VLKGDKSPRFSRSPSYTMGVKIESPSKNWVPGPGNYDSK
jgi:hypothetical protein